MPIYEYKCAKCGVVEVMQGIKEAPLKKCPNCKSKVERMISSTSFVLKGSGWYATDYGKKTPPPDTTGANGTNGGTSSGDKEKTSTEKSAASSTESKERKPAATEKATSAKSESSTKPAANKSD